MLKDHKPLGLLIGLAGNVMLAAALFLMLEGGECGRRAGTACAPGTGLGALLMPAGIVVSFAGMLLGGYVVTISGLFFAVGLGTLAATAFGTVGPGPWFGWPFGLSFVAIGLGLLRLFGNHRTAAERRAQRKARAEAKKAASRRV